MNWLMIFLKEILARRKSLLTIVSRPYEKLKKIASHGKNLMINR